MWFSGEVSVIASCHACPTGRSGTPCSGPWSR